jgi:DNA-binding response OmpR family regulator
MSRKRILLLEDDPNLGFMLQEHLELQGFDVSRYVNGEDGLLAWSRGGFDLCLVDIMMPRKDGFTVAREIRAKDRNVPIMFLTAKSMKEDRIEGFEIGGDDYVTKPFSMEELVLRIQAVLRRSSGGMQLQSGSEFTIGSIVFDHTRQMLVRGSWKQKLTAREADLLRLLCLNMNGTLEREAALKELWGDDTYFNGRSMDVFISKLRSYVKKDPAVGIINVHGRGYKLVVEQREGR